MTWALQDTVLDPSTFAPDAWTHGGAPVERRRSPVVSARLLGRFRVTVDGTTVDSRTSRRTRHLLAYLLAHRERPVPRDVLMSVFWPNAGERAARNSLHVALSGVRQALRAASPVPVIERWYDSYHLADAVTVWTDVEAFEQACREGAAHERAGDEAGAIASYEAAAHLYTGDYLADDPYLEWALVRREGLRLQAVEAHRRLVRLYADRGAHGPAIVLARQVLAMDPCNEDVHRTLIACYAAVGQVHLALAQYGIAAEALWDTFHARPSAETTALFDRLRLGRPL